VLDDRLAPYVPIPAYEVALGLRATLPEPTVDVVSE
jgi:hypothetical protein